MCFAFTPLRKCLRSDLKNAMEQWEQTLLQDLTEDEQQQLNSLLAKIRERVNKEA